MFTGLVAELGTVTELKPLKQSYNITVKAQKLLENLKIGDSIAVNGACLTVVKISGSAFTADIMPETVKLTNLRNLKSGDKVNLERTLKLSDGLDGHIVSGHVEGIGVITSKKAQGIAEIVTVKTPPQLLKYIIKKGSIAIDGISLTVSYRRQFQRIAYSAHRQRNNARLQKARRRSKPGNRYYRQICRTSA